MTVLQSLFEAARGGSWKPSLETVLSFASTPWALEMLLVFPGPLFSFVAWVTQIPQPSLPSPSQVDLSCGRKTAGSIQLKEIIDAGARHNNKMPVCCAVYDAVMVREGINSASPSRPTPKRSQPLVSSDDPVLKHLITIIGKSNSVVEMNFWILRATMAVSVLFLFYFFFIH